jgi:hypothetical protein
MTEHGAINQEGEKQAGVLSERMENNYFIIHILWIDGHESDIHIPTGGFPVVNPETQQRIGFLKGEEAVAILRRETPTKTKEEIRWADYLPNTKQNGRKS